MKLWRERLPTLSRQLWSVNISFNVFGNLALSSALLSFFIPRTPHIPPTSPGLPKAAVSFGIKVKNGQELKKPKEPNKEKQGGQLTTLTMTLLFCFWGGGQEGLLESLNIFNVFTFFIVYLRAKWNSCRSVEGSWKSFWQIFQIFICQKMRNYSYWEGWKGPRRLEVCNQNGF